MKKTNPIVDSAASVKDAHNKLQNARKNLAEKKKLFLKAEDENVKAMTEFNAAAVKHETALRELR